MNYKNIFMIYVFVTAISQVHFTESASSTTTSSFVSSTASEAMYADDDLDLLCIDSEAELRDHVQSILKAELARGEISYHDIDTWLAHFMGQSQSRGNFISSFFTSHKSEDFRMELVQAIKAQNKILSDQLQAMQDSSRQTKKALHMQKEALEYQLNGWKRKCMQALLGAVVSLSANIVQAILLGIFTNEDAPDDKNCTTS